jgi:hypothetical protein
MLRKRCPQCGTDKPLDKFYHDKRSKDAHDYACKDCRLARSNAYNVAQRARREQS